MLASRRLTSSPKKDSSHLTLFCYQLVSFSSSNLALLLVTAAFAFIVIAVVVPHQVFLKLDDKVSHYQLGGYGSQPFADKIKPSFSPFQEILRHHSISSYKSNHGRGLGAKYGSVQCDSDVSSFVSYWSDPRSFSDRSFVSPFFEETTTPPIVKYLSFEPDCGGWNNIRMEFEIMVVLAAATGRTLILPSDHPLYLLQKDEKVRHRKLQNFFQYHETGANAAQNGLGFEDVVNTITMKQFFEEEIFKKKTFPLPEEETNRTTVLNAVDKCDLRRKSEKSCFHLYEYLASAADYVPNWHGEKNCLIMDDENWQKKDIGFGVTKANHDNQIKQFCAARTPVYYNTKIHNARLIHFRSYEKDTRLLVHFYAFIHFTNPKIGNYFKRLVRDRVRYSDTIFCAAGKIVKALLGEAQSYSSIHLRRGDFQWKKMRISAEEWYENTRKILHPGELVYIATDETNRTFFEPLARHYELRFLPNYFELIGMNDLDPNFAGMIDQVVASRGRMFIGTYFSSFSAYIGRMRGYHGMSGRDMWYGQQGRMNETHSWVFPHTSYSAREFPTAWAGIDGNTEPSAKDFY